MIASLALAPPAIPAYTTSSVRSAQAPWPQSVAGDTCEPAIRRPARPATNAATSATHAVASARTEMPVSHTAAIAAKPTENADIATGPTLREMAQRATSLATGSASRPTARWLLASSSAAIASPLHAYRPFPQRTDLPKIVADNHAHSLRVKSRSWHPPLRARRYGIL